MPTPVCPSKGGREWLCSSSLHRANNTYALTQSSTFSRLREEPSDTVTLHTVKVKNHGIFLSLAPAKLFVGFENTKMFLSSPVHKKMTTTEMDKPDLRGRRTTVTHKYKNQYMGGEKGQNLVFAAGGLIFMRANCSKLTQQSCQ